MLTVKHIRFDGAESLDYADRVLFYPREGAAAVPGGEHPGSVSLITLGERGPAFDYSDGTVYVMNENGATVAKYNLGLGPRDAGYASLGAGASYGSSFEQGQQTA